LLRINALTTRRDGARAEEFGMSSIIYLVGLIVIVLAILSFLGIR
jgi:hypothetical protein